MKKTAFLSDIIFTFLTAFLLSTVFFRFLDIPFLPALLFSIPCAGLTVMGIGTYLMHKRKRYFLKRSDEALKNKLLTHLSLLSDEKKTRFFRSVIPSPEDRRSLLKIFTQDSVYFLSFRFNPVNQDEVARFSRLKTSKRKILLCGEIEERALLLCMRLQIEVQTGESVFRLVQSQNALPDVFLGEEAPVQKHKRKLRLCLAKSNSKRFLISGALVLLASVFTPFPVYYWVFGTGLLATATVIRIFGYSVT